MTSTAGRPPRRRRWGLIGVSAVWLAVVAVVAVWSVRRDPPTVQEQRDLAAAWPLLQRATGAVLAAVTGPDRAVVLGRTVLDDCEITSVRAGVEAVREVTVVVPAGRGLDVLRDLAGRLPADYHAEAGPNTGGKRIGLHADAGQFIGVDAAADADARTLSVRTSTGCRPPAANADVADPPAGAPPAALTGLLRQLGASADGLTTTAVACPDGTVVGTWTVSGLDAPAGLDRAVPPGATVIRSDPDDRAYLTGGASVVLTSDDTGLEISATTACQ